MQHENNLIQDDAKILVGEPFFNAKAARLAQPVVPLSNIQAENGILHVPVYAPPATLQPTTGKNYASLALILLFSVVAFGGVMAFYYFRAQNKTAASEISQQAIDDRIDDSVKSKTSISQKSVGGQPNRKVLSSTSAQIGKNKSDDQPPHDAQNIPSLTPDETEPGQWISKDAEDGDTPEPKTKTRRKNKTDDKFEKFVREVENAERQTRRLKKVLDDFSDN